MGGEGRGREGKGSEGRKVLMRRNDEGKVGGSRRRGRGRSRASLGGLLI